LKPARNRPVEIEPFKAKVGGQRETSDLALRLQIGSGLLQAGRRRPGSTRDVQDLLPRRGTGCVCQGSGGAGTPAADSREVAGGRVERRLGLRGCSKHDVRRGRTTHVRAHRLPALAGAMKLLDSWRPAYPEVYIRLPRYIARSFEGLDGGQSNIHDSGQGGYGGC
jgi:hypothetical protein